DADHHQAHPGGAGRVVGGVQAGPQLALEPQRLVVGQRPGRDVDLDVVLAELGLESRIVDVFEYPLVGHRRVDVVVDEIELELQAHARGTSCEAVPGEHSRQRVQATL